MALIVTNTESMRTLAVGLTIFKSTFREVTLWGELMACSCICSIPVILVFITGKKYLINNPLDGASKGSIKIKTSLLRKNNKLVFYCLLFNYKDSLYIVETASLVALVGAIPSKPSKDGVVKASSVNFSTSASVKPSSFNLLGTSTDFNHS